MDELKLSISTNFMRNLITKILDKLIFKKTGYHVGIQINEIKAESTDGKIRIHMDADVEMSYEDLKNILKTVRLI